MGESNQLLLGVGGILSRGVRAARVTPEGRLIFTMTDGNELDLGTVRGDKGDKGDPGAPAEVDATLTAEGKAADAKAAGDARAELRARLLQTASAVTPLLLTADAIDDNPGTVLMPDGTTAATASAPASVSARSVRLATPDTQIMAHAAARHGRAVPRSGSATMSAAGAAATASAVRNLAFSPGMALPDRTKASVGTSATFAASAGWKNPNSHLRAPMPCVSPIPGARTSASRRRLAG